MKKLISTTLASLFCVACLNAQTFDMKVAQPCYNDSIGYGWDVTNAIQAKKLDNFKAKSRTWKIAATYFF